MTGLYPELFLLNLSGAEPRRCHCLKPLADSSLQPGWRATVISSPPDGKLFEAHNQGVYTSWYSLPNPATVLNLLENTLYHY